MIPKHVTLVEVGPRDGLQNEKQIVSTVDKVALVQQLAAAGLRDIEVTSFVSPRWVPQMADAAAVMSAVGQTPGLRRSVLVPNLQGLHAALDAGAAARPDEVVVFGAASEAFSRRNINCSIAESVQRFAPVVSAARDAGLKVRGVISCALGCPYQGEVPVAAVAQLVLMMKDIGVQHCGVADTIGVGTPCRVQEVMAAALAQFPAHEVSGHFHDTYGQALANILACLALGVHTFDTSVAGLGGCPYAVGATGNVATEDVVFMLHGMGIATGIDLDRLARVGRDISERLGRPTASRTARALQARTCARTPS